MYKPNRAYPNHGIISLRNKGYIDTDYNIGEPRNARLTVKKPSLKTIDLLRRTVQNMSIYIDRK